MNIWLDKVTFVDGTVIRYEDENILWIQASDLGVRVGREAGPTVIHPWHRIHSCLEQDS